MSTYTVRREVIETINIEADDEADAITTADETPVDEWVRDVK